MHTLFLKENSANLRVVFFVLISLIVMSIDHQRDHSGKLRSALSLLIYPIQYVINIPIQFFNWSAEMVTTRASLMDENARMRKAQLVLNARMQRFEIIKAENKHLREILKSSEKLDERILIAELLAINLQSFRHQVIINKGWHNEVYDGQPIIDAKGIMGQIIYVGPFSSRVLLLTDPTHAIPVQINRNGLRSVAVGTGQSHLLQLEYLPNNADVEEGDLVVSSGLGHRFPPGYPVGTVNSIEVVPGELFAKITIIPNTQLVKNREVLLVWPKPSENVEFISNATGIQAIP